MQKTIHNTTYKIHESIYAQWMQWTCKSLESIKSDENIFNISILKVLVDDNDQSITLTLQITFRHSSNMKSYEASKMLEFQDAMKSKFGEQFVFFSTRLQILEEL